jgi:hypothetical protein
MHVMVAIHTTRGCTMQPLELLKLRTDDIFERCGKARVVNRRGNTMGSQETRKSPLALHKPRRALPCGKRCCQVEVEANIDSVLSRKIRSSFRILHEHHCAY